MSDSPPRSSAGQEISIGNHVLIANHVLLNGYDGHPLDPFARAAGERPSSDGYGPIRIGDYAWVGSKATILKNVSIGRGAVAFRRRGNEGRARSNGSRGQSSQDDSDYRGAGRLVSGESDTFRLTKSDDGQPAEVSQKRKGAQQAGVDRLKHR